MAGPLSGVRIIDLTTVISAPVATMILARQGAEVSGLNFRKVLMNLPKGDQLSELFGTINPNAKLPAIVDHLAKR